MSSNDASMSSPLFVPDALKFYVNRLSFSKNRVRLQTLSDTTAGPNSQVIVRLPSNTMLNLASLTMTGGVQVTIDNPAQSPATENFGVAPPTNWDFSFIETLSLIANGGIITQPFTNYKLLGNILNDVYGSNSKVFSRNALQGSWPQPLQRRDGTLQANDNFMPFAINNWISATQSMAPSYISTNLLGDLELRLTMTGKDIVASGHTEEWTPPFNPLTGLPATANINTTPAAVPGLQARSSWLMNNLNFYVETASIQSNLLEQAIAAKLAAGEPINVPFENVFSFSQSNSSANYNMRFSVSSQSVNKIIATTQLNSDLHGLGIVYEDPAPDPPTLAPQQTLVNGIPQALRRNSNAVDQAQFSINNQYSPNYQIDSGVSNGWAWAGLPTTGFGHTSNYQASNMLVETLAAMDIPDYDYDCSHKLTSTTQMPFEFLGGPVDPLQITGGPQVPTTNQQTVQMGAPVLYNTTTTVYGAQSGRKNPDSQWFPYQFKSGIDTYLDDKFVLATSFDLDVSDKERLVSGVNTLGSNAQLFLNSISSAGSPPVPESRANTSSVFVLCTSMIQIYAGATLKIIQ